MQKEEKLMKKLQEEQMRFLLKEAIGSQFGVKKTKAAANAAQLGLDQAQKEVTEFLEALSSDSESDDDSLDDNRDDVGGDEMELEEAAQGIEVFREKTIEDIIEEQRAKLAAEGKKGTPVTEESFAKWRAEKLAKKQAEAEARVKAESTKKKGGKGLCKFHRSIIIFLESYRLFITLCSGAIWERIVRLQRLTFCRR